MKWEEAARMSVYRIAVKRKEDGGLHGGYLVRHIDGQVWKSMWKEQMLVKVNGIKGREDTQGWRPIGFSLGKGLVAKRCKEEDENILNMLRLLGVRLERRENEKANNDRLVENPGDSRRVFDAGYSERDLMERSGNKAGMERNRVRIRRRTGND